jgi:hypothetical protein
MTEQTADVVNLHDKPANAIDVPGGWIVVRDPLTVRAKDRKAIAAAMDRARNAGAGNILMAYDSGEATMMLAIEQWSFELPIPRENPGGIADDGSEIPSSLDQLEIPTYDAISEALIPFGNALFPNFGTPSTDTSKSDPSGPSSA